MSQLQQFWKVWCETEDAWVGEWAIVQPTVCPNNSADTIEAASWKAAYPLGLNVKIPYNVWCFALDLASPSAVVIAATDTYVKLVGCAQVDNNEAEFASDTVTVKSAGIYEIIWQNTVRDAAGAGATTLKFAVAINGSVDSNSEIAADLEGTSWLSVSSVAIFDLAVDDTVELMVANVDNTNDLQMAAVHASLSLKAQK